MPSSGLAEGESTTMTFLKDLSAIVCYEFEMGGHFMFSNFYKFPSALLGSRASLFFLIL